MLVVTTTMRMFDGVHSNTTSSRPAVTFDLVFVEGASGLEHGFIDSTTTSDDSDGCTGARDDGFLGATGESDAGSSGFRVVADDGGVVSAGTGQASTVSRLLLNVTDDCSLRKGCKRQDVADRQAGLLSAVDERSRREPLGRNERLRAHLVPVGIPENHAGKWGSTSRLVEDLLYQTTDVAIALGKVERAEGGWCDPVFLVSLEDTTALTLISDDSAHGGR